MKSTLFVASLLLVTACADSNAPKPIAPTSPPPSPVADAPASPHALPAKHVEYVFTAPEGWVSETPRTMRKLQYKLARQGADADDVEVWVSIAGGTREANLARWLGEFVQPDGKETKDVAKTSTRKVNGIEMFEFDVSGTCVAGSGMMGGATDAKPKENWREIVTSFGEGQEQWFVKIRGPIGSVAYWEPSYRKFVESVK